MKDLLIYLAQSLVDNPEEVEVTEIETDKSIVLEIRVAPDDMGKIIGRQGRIAKAIRSITKAAAAKEGKRINVEIIG